MSEIESIIERYRIEMMEMHRRASLQPASEEPVQSMDEEITETIEKTEAAEEIAVEETEILPEAEETEHTDEVLSVCPVCGGKIAFCSFGIKSADSGLPIEYAQVTLHREDGFFIRVLADEEGRTCEFPLCSEMPWRVSVTAEGYIPVSGAVISPSSGDRLNIPVELYESLSLRDVFAQNHQPFEVT